MSRGFTLIELVIGMAVLITALLGILGVFVGIRAMNEGSRNQTIATHLADRIMEEIRASDFETEIRLNAQATNDDGPPAQNWIAWATANNLALTDPNIGGECVDFDPPFEPPGAPVPRCAGDTQPETWSATADPLRVQVRVNWVERGGRQRVTYLETLVTDRDQ